jgi:hypothetical protein
MYILAPQISVLKRFGENDHRVQWQMPDWQVGDNSCRDRTEALKLGSLFSELDGDKWCFLLVHVLEDYKPGDLLVLEETIENGSHEILYGSLYEATIGLDKAVCFIEKVTLPATSRFSSVVFNPITLKPSTARLRQTGADCKRLS